MTREKRKQFVAGLITITLVFVLGFLAGFKIGRWWEQVKRQGPMSEEKHSAEELAFEKEFLSWIWDPVEN